ncbi:MAG: NAD-dependent epimerase/dehydratase family protein [Bermanella sp.]
MKILITGAAGDIGTRLLKVFRERLDINLYSTDLMTLPHPVNSYHKACDIRSDEFFTWVETIKPDVIIHLASIVQLPKNMTIEQAHDIDVKATERLLEVSAKIGVKKFVITSSGAAYGYWKDNAEWLTEDMPVRGNDDYFYSSHKRQVEEILARYRKDSPLLKQVILRPGTVLGPNFENPITQMFSKNIITGIAGSDSPFVIIWVDDLVAYLIEAATTDVEGIYNVAGDGTLSLKAIAKRLNKLYLPIPPNFLRFMLGLLKPLGMSQYGPEQVKFIEFRPVLANDKIKSEFKHQPRKSTLGAFESFLQETDKEYVKP